MNFFILNVNHLKRCEKGRFIKVPLLFSFVFILTCGVTVASWSVIL